MKYFCKLVYRDEVRPTTYFENEEKEKLVERFEALVKKFIDDDSISGVFIGKKEG